jgi:hypothetical protein
MSASPIALPIMFILCIVILAIAANEVRAERRQTPVCRLYDILMNVGGRTPQLCRLLEQYYVRVCA